MNSVNYNNKYATSKMVESDSVERIKYLWKRSNLRKYMRKFIIRKDIVKKKVV